MPNLNVYCSYLIYAKPTKPLNHKVIIIMIHKYGITLLPRKAYVNAGTIYKAYLLHIHISTKKLSGSC